MKSNKLFGFVMVVLCVASLGSLPLRAQIWNQEPIQIEGGSITGLPGWGWGVRLYRGIPFAAPPVGDLRWRSPQPIVPWKGVLAADHFSPACIQPTRSPNGDLWNDGLAITSEDCLYLNVWTAAKSANDKLPVMVYIHGGGMFTGSGDEPVFDGSNLTKKGVIVVTFNYRLGIFGFLAHPELTAESEHHSSGSYAMLDQLAALRWVQNNIAKFGGDPTKVTLFGQSGGSRSVLFATASPLGKGLFQRAIAQSHAPFAGLMTLAEGEAQGKRFGEAAGAPNLAALRNMSAQDLLAAYMKYRVGYNFTAPLVDGWYLPTDVYSIYSHGQQNDMPILTGATNDEPGLSGFSTRNGATKTGYEEWARKTFGKDADQFLRLYPAATDAAVIKAFHDANRDANFTGHRTLVQLQNKTGHSKPYLYMFSHLPPHPSGVSLPPALAGAVHAADLFYTWDWLRGRDYPWTETDRRLADQMSSYWTNFAKTGDPNGPGLPVWPAYDPKTDEMFDFGDVPHLVPTPDKAGLDFLAAHGDELSHY